MSGISMTVRGLTRFVQGRVMLLLGAVDLEFAVSDGNYDKLLYAACGG